mmetsp:Transcript_33990/g.73712  ORF Transcript_33990/g.73712 Transcript_33990/m.73712 type:complete len:245 (+) Transcript_33990:1262-1996(+)
MPPLRPVLNSILSPLPPCRVRLVIIIIISSSSSTTRTTRTITRAITIGSIPLVKGILLEVLAQVTQAMKIVPVLRRCPFPLWVRACKRVHRVYIRRNHQAATRTSCLLRQRGIPIHRCRRSVLETTSLLTTRKDLTHLCQLMHLKLQAPLPSSSTHRRELSFFRRGFVTITPFRHRRFFLTMTPRRSRRIKIIRSIIEQSALVRKMLPRSLKCPRPDPLASLKRHPPFLPLNKSVRVLPLLMGN